MGGGGRKTLKTLIGTYPHTAPLKSGALRSDRLDFEFTEIVPVWDGFKGMIRDDRYDVSEMAIVTYLLAKAHGKPLALLPAAMIGRFQHPYAIYNASKGPMTPADLNGKRVGIRSFTTTTGAWIRGILANDYGVDLDSIEWITFEEPHVAEYKDSTQRAPEGKKIVPMLLDGELDAVLGEKVEHADLKPLFADVSAEEKAWSAKHGIVPINHLVVVKLGLSKEHPDAVREVHRLIAESAKGVSAAPHFTADEMRRSLELMIRYCTQQGLIPRAAAVDDLFEGETLKLWNEAT